MCFKHDGLFHTLLSLAFIQHTRSSKQHLQISTVIIMKDTNANCRINAKISKENYIAIDDLMKKGELISMKLSKGAILDIALSCMFNALQHETLDGLAIQHLERLEDIHIDKVIAGESV